MAYKFRHYLLGNQFIFYVDHMALMYLVNKPQIYGRIWCTPKLQERGRLVQVEWKWYGELSRDNFKHKFYMAHNLWEKAPFASL
jgi:hypothetical protein